MTGQTDRVSLTWREIREHVLNACGQTTDAAAEFFHHATAANREICAVVEVRELEREGKVVTVKEGDDRVSLPDEIYAVHHIFNQTTGQRLEPEESGLHGRSRYLEEDTGQPQSGTVHRYVPVNRQILLRNTADEPTTLRLSYKIVPPDITKERLSEIPITPPHLDWALINLTAANYLSTHPGDEVAFKREMNLRNRAWAIAMGQPKTPKALENRDRRERLHQFGYFMGRRRGY